MPAEACWRAAAGGRLAAPRWAPRSAERRVAGRRGARLSSRSASDGRACAEPQACLTTTTILLRETASPQCSCPSPLRALAHHDDGESATAVPARRRESVRSSVSVVTAVRECLLLVRAALCACRPIFPSSPLREPPSAPPLPLSGPIEAHPPGTLPIQTAPKKRRGIAVLIGGMGQTGSQQESKWDIGRECVTTSARRTSITQSLHTFLHSRFSFVNDGRE